jgi:hypothetical protein
LVLINTAGRVLGRDEVEGERRKMNGMSVAGKSTEEPRSDAGNRLKDLYVQFGSRVLLWGLRPRIEPICRDLYPSRPERVTKVLVDDIYRDSLDEGAEFVMIAGSKLPEPRTANELLGAEHGNDGSEGEGMFPGPVLVLQGTSDPLNDAVGR